MATGEFHPVFSRAGANFGQKPAYARESWTRNVMSYTQPVRASLLERARHHEGSGPGLPNVCPPYIKCLRFFDRKCDESMLQRLGLQVVATGQGDDQIRPDSGWPLPT